MAKPILNKAREQNLAKPREECNEEFIFSKELLTELQNNTFSERNWKEEGLLSDEVLSNKEWEEHKYGNPPNDSFPKPYLNINNEKDKNHHNENNKDTDKSSGMDLSGAPQYENISNQQPNEGKCRVDKFEVIKYTIRGNEEFLAICTRECDSWA
ncbi:hypothetical protein Tco_0741973 [Tanacetum coccineum]